MGFLINPYVFQAGLDGPTPTHEGEGGFATNGTSTNPVNVSFPGTVLFNDIAILHAIILDAGGPNTLNTPAGWTLISQVPVFSAADTTTSMGLFWKRCAGTEGGSTVNITASTAHGATDTFGGVISLWRGCRTSGDPHETSATAINNNANMVGASVTTAGTNRRIAHFGTCYLQATCSPDTGYTERYDAQTNSGTAGAGVSCNEIEAASAGVVSSATHILSTSRRWRTISLALVPA